MKGRPTEVRRRVLDEDGMTMMRLGGFAAAALAAALTFGGARAQTTPADPLAPGAGAESAQSDKAGADEAEKPAAKATKPKPRAHGAATIAVTVHNERSVGLVQLNVGPAGDPNPKKVVGALAFGRKTVIHLKRTKDCLYDIRGRFADEADTEQLGVELCKDRQINLTD